MGVTGIAGGRLADARFCLPRVMHEQPTIFITIKHGVWAWKERLRDALSELWNVSLDRAISIITLCPMTSFNCNMTQREV